VEAVVHAVSCPARSTAETSNTTCTQGSRRSSEASKRTRATSISSFHGDVDIECEMLQAELREQSEQLEHKKISLETRRCSNSSISSIQTAELNTGYMVHRRDYQPAELNTDYMAHRRDCQTTELNSNYVVHRRDSRRYSTESKYSELRRNSAASVSSIMTMDLHSAYEDSRLDCKDSKYSELRRTSVESVSSIKTMDLNSGYEAAHMPQYFPMGQNFQNMSPSRLVQDQLGQVHTQPMYPAGVFAILPMRPPYVNGPQALQGPQIAPEPRSHANSNYIDGPVFFPPGNFPTAPASSKAVVPPRNFPWNEGLLRSPGIESSEPGRHPLNVPPQRPLWGDEAPPRSRGNCSPTQHDNGHGSCSPVRHGGCHGEPPQHPPFWSEPPFAFARPPQTLLGPTPILSPSMGGSPAGLQEQMSTQQVCNGKKKGKPKSRTAISVQCGMELRMVPTTPGLIMGNMKQVNTNHVNMNHVNGIAPSQEARRTTVMLRNLPEEFVRDMVMDMLAAEGFAQSVDFVYVPMNFRSSCSFGYGFVNFTLPEVAEACRIKFEGYKKWPVCSPKVCEVSWSDMHQGFEAHIERYRNSPLMHDSVPDDFRPAVFMKGVRVPFPAPTRPIRAPRIRRANAQEENGLPPQ